MFPWLFAHNTRHISTHVHVLMSYTKSKVINNRSATNVSNGEHIADLVDVTFASIKRFSPQQKTYWMKSDDVHIMYTVLFIFDRDM